MIPISIDPASVPLAVAGRGTAALRRFRALGTSGAGRTIVYSDRPTAALSRAVGDALRPYLPDTDALRELRLLWIAGLPDGEAAALAEKARHAGVLVNVEDRPLLCDFHSVAEVRRGDLLLTVSTGGRSPGLAARIRARLGEEFGPEWAERVSAIGRRRTEWRRQRRSMPELARLTNETIDSAGWLR